MENMKIVSLDTVKKGQKAVVQKLMTTDKALRRRLLDMGLTKGVEVLIKKIAPLGDPIDIQIRDYELCIRKSDLKNILVGVIK